MKEVVITILAAILIIYIARTSSYRKDDPIIVTQYDTVYQQKTFTKYTKGDSIPFLIVAVDTAIIHDTIQIIKDYNTTKVYTDTFTLDSSHFAIIDTISHNSIIGRQFKADLHEKTIFVTNNIYHKPKNELYLGVLGDLRRFDNKIGIGLGLGYKTAKNGLFSISATTNNISFGYYKKLF
jgi:hypothetical protein